MRKYEMTEAQAITELEAPGLGRDPCILPA
jgi:hypothetical protein